SLARRSRPPTGRISAHGDQPRRPGTATGRMSASHRALELGLGHLRAAAHVLALRLAVQLSLGSAACTTVRAESATATRRDVIGGRAAGGPRLARTRPLLVHGARGDLFGRVLRLASFEQAILDVLVLAFALRVPGSLGHVARVPGPRPAETGALSPTR